MMAVQPQRVLANQHMKRRIRVSRTDARITGTGHAAFSGNFHGAAALAAMARKLLKVQQHRLRGETAVSYRSAIAPVLLVSLLGLALPVRADVVTQWNQNTIAATKTAAATANFAARALAIVHIAVYDALAAIDGTHAPYHAADLEVPADVIPEVAAIGAAHYALVVLYPAQRTALNAKLKDALAAYPKGEARDASLNLGVAAANDILTLRATDGSTVTTTYPGGTGVNQWRPTPPDPPKPAVDPSFGAVKPFVISNVGDLRVAPPAITSAEYATAYNEVLALGVKTGSTRTADQETIARFWAQDTHVAYNAIARQIVGARSLSIYDTARLFAQLNIAMTDARIATWDSKYFYGTWRPVTAINTSDDDGNAGTTPDAEADWLPLLDTPAHPEYPSGHAATGAAAATVLQAWFGDEVGFTAASETLSGVARAFASVWQSAVENGDSRIYGGIHFRFAETTGLALGKSVGQSAVANLFAELPPPPPVVDAGASDDDAGVIADAGAPPVIADAGHPAADAAASAVDAGHTKPATRDAGSATVDGGHEPESGRDAGVYVVDAGNASGDDRDHDDGCSVMRPSSHGGSSTPIALLAAIVVLRLRRDKFVRSYRASARRA
jgi:membrane-associated phospholipid phosphatase